MRKLLLGLMVTGALACMCGPAAAATPAPEPGSLALLASGVVVGIGYMRSRLR